MIVNAIKNGFQTIDDPKLFKMKTNKRTGKIEIACPASDLADAYWIAQIIRTEVGLRTGTINLKTDLTDNQRKLLMKTTPSRKINYLYLDFIGEFHAEIF